MTESITVNGVVFERVGSQGDAVIYANGALQIESVDKYGIHLASCGKRVSRWRRSPGEALNELANNAQAWAPVLRELARINGGAV